MMDAEPPTFDLRLSALVYGGECLGRLPDERAVFVPFALPGEKVRLRLVEEKPRYARAELLEILEPSPKRITPRCLHFGVCGGCHYQHLSYQDQLDAKTAILVEQLERIGKFVNPPVEAPVPAPAPFYYRNHVQFQITTDGNLGYHLARSDQPFPIRECHLPEERLNSIWPLLDINADAAIKRIGLRLGAGDDAMLILESDEPGLPEFSVEDLTLSTVHLGPAGAQVLAGSDHFSIEVLGKRFRVSATSFFQVNTPMAEKLVTHLLEGLDLSNEATVLELFSGVGLFSAFLAAKTSRLVCVESSASACEDFMYNLEEFSHVELYESTVEMALPSIQIAPEVLVMDPPREGVDRHALEALLNIRPRQIAYVSCDPATLARDGRRLREGGYHLVRVTPFDLFPQTYHIESISFWMVEGGRFS